MFWFKHQPGLARVGVVSILWTCCFKFVSPSRKAWEFSSSWGIISIPSLVTSPWILWWGGGYRWRTWPSLTGHPVWCPPEIGCAPLQWTIWQGSNRHWLTSGLVWDIWCRCSEGQSPCWGNWMHWMHPPGGLPPPPHLQTGSSLLVFPLHMLFLALHKAANTHHSLDVMSRHLKDSLWY